MHPEILRQLNVQRGREMQARAHQARFVRMIRSARRGHGRPDQADEFVLPPIPDYVDGSFHAASAGVAPAGAASAGVAPAGVAPAGVAPVARRAG
jgi:hypothetical protein